MAEIEKLKKELNDRLDAFENKPKPKYEIGKWYWTDSGSLYFIEKINGNMCYGYGLNWANNWMTGVVCDLEYIKRIATDAKVTEMLTKEAIKRGLVQGAKINIDAFNHIYINGVSQIPFKGNGFRYNVFSSKALELNGKWVMQNGIWATVIKERSLEEWHQEWRNSTKSLKDYIKSTKTELIEILKNLPNE